MTAAATWAASHWYNDAFPPNEEGWSDTSSDEAFTRLRLQGPNPFLLRATAEAGGFEVDYGRYFTDIHAPVRCAFRLEDGALRPASICVGEATTHPGEPGWERAKLVANALDARYAVFTRHLLETHLFVGQAFALSAYALPPSHGLRSFLDLFTYGTLVVNDFAYRLLITPASYFLQSGFISGEDAMRLFHNSVAAFRLDDLIVPRDVAARGIDTIPDHPYVADALESWALFHAFVSGYVGELYPDDAAVVADAELGTWYGALADLLPNRDVTDDPLDGRARLTDVLTCLLYNNVHHEVCGDFSPYGQSRDPDDKRLIDLARLAAGDTESPPRAADVFLYDQGAFAGRFHNAGNNLMTLPVAEATRDERLQAAVRGLQEDLLALDARLEARNQKRAVPFSRMMPRYWEASISF